MTNFILHSAALRYQYTPNDHNLFALVYSWMFHANPTKVHDIFSESLIIVDYGGIFIKTKNVKVF